MANITLGITIGLIACCVQSLGLTIQRKSHVLDQALPPHLQTRECKRPLWLLGFAIFITSNVIGSFVQIASLPVVILAPLGAVSLLWNAFFARIILGDLFSPWIILGTLLIAGGAVLIALFGIVPEQTRSLEDLLELFRRPAFMVYFSILGVFVVVCLTITHVAEYSLTRKYIPCQSPADIEAVATEQTPLLDPKPVLSPDDAADRLNKLARMRMLISLSYASFSGILSGMCLIFAKSGVELLLLTIKGNNQFWRWQAWLLILALVAFALLQMWYLHRALIFAGPVLVCPSAFCFYNLSSIVNGLVYFNQFSLIPSRHLVLVSVGIVVLLAGVWVVSIQAEPPEEPIEEGDASDMRASEEVTAPQLRDGSRIGSLRMERVSLSESSVIPNTIQETASSSTTLQAGRDLRQPASYTYTPRQLLLRRYPSHRATGSSSIQLTNEAPAVSTLGTGFQIGLSPISPGFEIVPRRRRTTLTEGELVEERVRRRAVSESEGGRPLMRRIRPGLDSVGKGKSASGRGWKWAWWK